MTATIALPVPPEGLTVSQFVSKTRGQTRIFSADDLDVAVRHFNRETLFESDCIYAVAFSPDPELRRAYPHWIQSRGVIAKSYLDPRNGSWSAWQ